MIGPGGVGEVDRGLLRVEFGEEEAAQVDSASARDGLQGTNLDCGDTSALALYFVFLLKGVSALNDLIDWTYPFLSD